MGLPPLLCSTLVQAFQLLELSPALPPDLLPKPSGTSSNWQLLLSPAGRREACLSPEPPVLFPDPLPKPSGTSSSWLPSLPPLLCSTLVQAFQLLELSPASPPDLLPKPSGTSSSWQLLLPPAGRREVCPSQERSPALFPALRLRLNGIPLN